LRHTTLTWVERSFGYPVAHEYAGHTDTGGSRTSTYTQATLEEVAAALSALTGEPHPLATTSPEATPPSAAVPAGPRRTPSRRRPHRPRSRHPPSTTR
jgi:hypothetical protein